MLQAVRLRDALRDTLDDPRALAEAFDEVTEAKITPWYRAQITADRARFAQIEALREGREPQEPADELSKLLAQLFAALLLDPDLFRAGLEYVATITPIQEIVHRPMVAEKLRAVTESMRGSPPIEMPGPTREELLELVR